MLCVFGLDICCLAKKDLFVWRTFSVFDFSSGKLVFLDEVGLFASGLDQFCLCMA